MKEIIFLATLSFLLTSCLDYTQFKAARYVKPDEARRYRAKGVLVFGTIDKENSPFLANLHFMLKKSEDITYVVNQDFCVFVFDVAENTEGIERMVMMYYNFGVNFWMTQTLPFKVEKDKLNYMGRFIFYAKDNFKPHRVIITNLLEEDIQNLAKDYPDLTNMQVYPVGVREGLYKFY